MDRFNDLRWSIFISCIFLQTCGLHQHFKSDFSANFLLLKNFKAKRQVQKSCANNFGMKELLTKCWWKKHLVYADFPLQVRKIFQRVEFQGWVFLLGFPFCAIGAKTTPENFALIRSSFPWREFVLLETAYDLRTKTYSTKRAYIQLIGELFSFRCQIFVTYIGKRACGHF